MWYDQKLLTGIYEAQQSELEIAQVGVNGGITGDPLFTFWVYILEKQIRPL